MTEIPVIDIFAGPGGLSYGFGAYKDKNISFRIKLSIEKDPIAHRTLLLRAFLRQFSSPPEEYYQYLRNQGVDRQTLQKKYPSQWASAEQEVQCWELGKIPFAQVSGAIRKAISEHRLWVLLGGPPCQAYSLAGRSRMKNDKTFAADEKHTLYREYLKIVSVHQPAMFVMENVKGILSSTHGSRQKDRAIFFQILEDLRDPAGAVREERDLIPFLPRQPQQYHIFSFVNSALMPEALDPEEFLIQSEDWGIPQRRHRVILLGIRADIHVEPKTLDAFFKRESVNIEDILGGMPTIRSSLSKVKDSPDRWKKVISGIARPKLLPKSVGSDVLVAIRDNLLNLQPHCPTGYRYVKGTFRPEKLANWIWDPKLGGVVEHQSRGHMAADLRRYFFAACYAKTHGHSPKLRHFPAALLPKHKNARRKKKGTTSEENPTIDFADRFRVQVKGAASTTVTSHISKDGHYYIHYDPTQCRSLTVREAARLQTFPDNYFFEGNRTQQYHQVGNAVPPLLALKLATLVSDALARHSNQSAKTNAGRATKR